MEMPCQRVFWYVLPAIRREIAKSMVDMQKKRHEIAEKLGVTEAAVSQYMSGKRGCYDFPENIRNEIRSASRRIIDGDGNEFAIMKELCRICKFIQQEKIWNDFRK